MTRRMKSVVDAKRFWASYLRGQFLETALIRTKVFNSHFVCVSEILRETKRL